MATTKTQTIPSTSRKLQYRKERSFTTSSYETTKNSSGKPVNTTWKGEESISSPTLAQENTTSVETLLTPASFLTLKSIPPPKEESLHKKYSSLQEFILVHDQRMSHQMSQNSQVAPKDKQLPQWLKQAKSESSIPTKSLVDPIPVPSKVVPIPESTKEQLPERSSSPPTSDREPTPKDNSRTKSPSKTPRGSSRNPTPSPTRWAGGAFSNSPAANTLPIPNFNSETTTTTSKPTDLQTVTDQTVSQSNDPVPTTTTTQVVPPRPDENQSKTSSGVNILMKLMQQTQQMPQSIHYGHSMPLELSAQKTQYSPPLSQNSPPHLDNLTCHLKTILKIH